MKNIKRHLRHCGYILLILLAAVGLSFGGAAPVLMRQKGPKQKELAQVEEVRKDQEGKISSQKELYKV